MPPWTGKAGSFPINVESIISAFPAPVKPFFPMRKNAPTVPKNSRSMEKLCVFAVEIADALLLHQREAEKRLCVQILCAQPDRRDAPVFIGRVVIDAGFCVAAARVQRDLVFSVLQLAAAARLLDGGQDVEKLADRGFLRVI